MDLLSATLTLFLVMDPIGNVPVFLAYLKDVEPRRRARVIVRESVVALTILLVFFFFGPSILQLLGIHGESLYLAGGVVLFLISIGMVFPETRAVYYTVETTGDGEPFIVPLATPLLAGPSTFATLMIFVSTEPQRFWQWLVALVVAWSLTAGILTLSAHFSRVLGRRGLMAAQRLMGMVLTVIAVQMFLDGIEMFLDAMPR